MICKKIIFVYNNSCRLITVKFLLDIITITSGYEKTNFISFPPCIFLNCKTFGMIILFNSCRLRAWKSKKSWMNFWNKKLFRLDIRLQRFSFNFFFKLQESTETLKIYWRVISLFVQNNKLVNALFEKYKNWESSELNARLEENIKMF